MQAGNTYRRNQAPSVIARSIRHGQALTRPSVAASVREKMAGTSPAMTVYDGRYGRASGDRERHMKCSHLVTLALLAWSIVLAGCTEYPYNHYQSNGGYYYYGPHTLNPTYFGPDGVMDP
jgi:hypothetical protein